MSTILDEIVANKHKEIQERKKIRTYKELQKFEFFTLERTSLKEAFINSLQPAVIAEFKRRSPSQSAINLNASVKEVSIAYDNGGAIAMSVLTDEKYFGGSDLDVIKARQNSKIPILRKEFIVDEYQLIEAKALGADVILLIASVLNKKETYSLARQAKQYGLEVLLELRDEEEAGHINYHVDFVGVNNRNLDDFSVNIDQSLKVAEFIPDEFIKISESGLSNPDDVKMLYQAGFEGFLMGEHFMRQEFPQEALAKFIEACKIPLDVQ